MLSNTTPRNLNSTIITQLRFRHSKLTTSDYILGTFPIFLLQNVFSWYYFHCCQILHTSHKCHILHVVDVDMLRDRIFIQIIDRMRPRQQAIHLPPHCTTDVPYTILFKPKTICDHRKQYCSQ